MASPDHCRLPAPPASFMRQSQQHADAQPPECQTRVFNHQCAAVIVLLPAHIDLPPAGTYLTALSSRLRSSTASAQIRRYAEMQFISAGLRSSPYPAPWPGLLAPNQPAPAPTRARKPLVAGPRLWRSAQPPALPAPAIAPPVAWRAQCLKPAALAPLFAQCHQALGKSL